MKPLISIVFFGIFLFALNAKSQTSMDVNNSADYLMITTEQQEIYLRRFLEANSEIAAQCQPGWSIDQSNQYFIEWVKNNPQFLRRNLTSSFTAALLSACKISVKK
jgi:hypothetical protein